MQGTLKTVMTVVPYEQVGNMPASPVKQVKQLEDCLDAFGVDE